MPRTERHSSSCSIFGACTCSPAYLPSGQSQLPAQRAMPEQAGHPPRTQIGGEVTAMDITITLAPDDLRALLDHAFVEGSRTRTQMIAELTADPNFDDGVAFAKEQIRIVNNTLAALIGVEEWE